MDSKMKLMAVAMVAIVVVSAVAVYAVVSNDSGDDSPVAQKAEGRLLVFGNANNDDYLDNNDVAKIQEILDSKVWDKVKYPFADANADGAVEADDVDYLKVLLEGKEKTKMYYLDYYSHVSYVHYPITGNIAATLDYGLMVTSTLGVYDRVTAADSKCLTYSEGRYPGCHDFIDLGTLKTDVPAFAENVLKNDCSVVIGRISQSLYDTFRDLDQPVDQILLGFTNSSFNGDAISGLLTCGALFSKLDEAREYVFYYDDMNEYIHSQVDSIPKSTFICAYDPKDPVITGIDTTGADGTMFGDVWTLSHLPLVDIADKIGNGNYKTEIENVIKKDPDYIIITMWGVINDESTPAEGQALFDEKCQYFKESRAYKEGHIYGVCYETYGTYLGPSGLALLCSYIWPDLFDEDKGWEMLQDCYDRFTLLDKDVKQSGGLQCFKMQ